MIGSQKRARVRRLTAETLTPGQQLLGPDGQLRGEIVKTAVEHDDFGTPALLLATVTSGETLRIAAGSQVDVALDENDGAPSSIPAEDGTPEAVIARAAAVHGQSPRVQELAGRLGRGMNFKSGSSLQDLHDLALTLFVDLADPDNALHVADLINPLPFDGNFGRWKWIEGALALSAYITHDDGRTGRADSYAAALRSADTVEADPLKAKLASAVLQRQLNEPNLYDREILRSSTAGESVEEKEWRILRLTVLLYLRAHGGSQTISDDELGRRIHNELLEIRALTG